MHREAVAEPGEVDAGEVDGGSHPDGRKGLKGSRPMRRPALGNKSDESTRRSGEIVVVNRKSSSRSAGINQLGAEVARALRERSSKPLGPEFCTKHREVLGEA